MSNEPEMSLHPKRVVAGLDGEGRSVALSSGLPTGLKNMHGVELAELWCFDDTVRSPTDGGDIECELAAP